MFMDHNESRVRCDHVKSIHGGGRVERRCWVNFSVPTKLKGRARAYCACSRCGWGLFGHFFLSSIFFTLLSPTLGDGLI